MREDKTVKIGHKTYDVIVKDGDVTAIWARVPGYYSSRLVFLKRDGRTYQRVLAALSRNHQPKEQ